jgi:8-oxo-dGTP pyrophosphatase MutT (NUDIX family)
MAEHYRHSVSVAGVTVDDAGRVLMIKRRDNGEWQAPGGILEATEQIEEGLRREVFEETGVEIEAEHLTGVYKHMGLGVVALVFRCRAVGGVAGPTDESVAAEWRMPEEITGEMSEAFAIRVQDALSGPWPHVRAHDGRNLLKG